MKAVAIIPARGGSQRIRGKNWKLFHGKPIIAYSIETAIRSGIFDAVYVSTDSVEIMEIANRYGALTVSRQPDMAENHIGTQQVTGEALNQIGAHFDLACCIYPTASMMSVRDLHRGRLAMRKRDALFAFSVGTKPLCDAGQFYFGYPTAFKTHSPLFDTHSVMVPIDSNRVCDINTPDDWACAERMYSELHGLARAPFYELQARAKELNNESL